MPDLAALLVEAGAASAADLERAAARQREQGGRLDTAILELDLLREEDLVAWLARASGLPPPPPGPVDPDIRARRVFPARVAERHGLAPFRLEGRELSILAAHPVDLAALDEISFMLSLHLVAHVAPEWQVRELMARTYGVALQERFAALAEKARAAAVAASPAAGAPDLDPPQAPAPDRDEARSGARGEEMPPGSPRPRDQAPDPDDLDISIDESFSFEPAAEVPAADAAAPEEPPPEGAPAAEPPTEGHQEPSAPAASSPRAEPEEPLAAALAQALSATDPEALLHDAPGPPAERDAPPRWSREEAFAALESAQGREGVVAVALRYTRHFFEAAALFAVTKEHVSGQDAVGWEGARERCRSLQLTPDAVGLFRAVLETSGPYLGPVAQERGNESLLAAIGRAWPRTALVYPVRLRDRTVCILYADNGDAPVSPRRLGDLLLFACGLSGAFERVLRHAKRIRAVAPPLGGGVPPPAGAAVAAPAAGAGTTADVVEPAASGTAPDEHEWKLREAARVDERPPPAADGAPEPFHVTRVDEALEPPDSIDAADMVQRLCGTRRGSADRGKLIAHLVQRGPEAAAALRAAFPGPLDVPPGHAEAVAAEERGPVLAALHALGIVATPYLAHLLSEPDAERRKLAALLLGRMRDPAAFLPLADRAFDLDAGVRAAALAALSRARRDLDFPPVLERLRREILGDDLARAAAAAAALARLGDGGAIPLLIEALDAPDPVSDAAAGALEHLTCRRFGRDAPRWLAWWKDRRGRRRAEWLFEALEDEDRDVRAAAAERLREAGSPPLPFLPDASPAERAEAGRAWRAWWDARGLAV